MLQPFLLGTGQEINDCYYVKTSWRRATGRFRAQSSAYACTTTMGDGTFEVPDLPALTNMVLVVSKAGYVPVVLSIQTASSPMDERANPIYLYDPSTENNPPGVTVDYQNKGQIIVFDVGSDSDASAAVTMSSLADGSPPAGVGPVSQTLGGAIVPAGLYTLTMVDSADDCEPDLMPLAPRGFPLTQPKHAIQVLVMNGYVSGAVGFICTPNPVIVATGDGG